MVARVALGHRGAASVRRERQPLDLPRRLVQRARGARVEVQPGDVAPRTNRTLRVGRRIRSRRTVSSPSQSNSQTSVSGGPTSALVAGRQVEHEEPAARVARAQDRGVGRRPGAVHGARAPVQPVAAGIGHQDQQPRAVARPRHATRPNRRTCPTCTGSLAGDHRVRKLMARRDPIREERESRRRRATTPASGRSTPRPSAAVGVPVAIHQVEVARVRTIRRRPPWRAARTRRGTRPERTRAPPASARRAADSAVGARPSSISLIRSPRRMIAGARRRTAMTDRPSRSDRSAIATGSADPDTCRSHLGAKVASHEGAAQLTPRHAPPHHPCLWRRGTWAPARGRGREPISLIDGGRRSALRADRRFGARREPRTPPSCPLREGCGSGIRPPQAPHAHASRRDRYALPSPLPRVRD